MPCLARRVRTFNSLASGAGDFRSTVVETCGKNKGSVLEGTLIGICEASKHQRHQPRRSHARKRETGSRFSSTLVRIWKFESRNLRLNLAKILSLSGETWSWNGFWRHRAMSLLGIFALPAVFNGRAGRAESYTKSCNRHVMWNKKRHNPVA